jgi:hypothetical protein
VADQWIQGLFWSDGFEVLFRGLTRGRAK